MYDAEANQPARTLAIFARNDLVSKIRELPWHLINAQTDSDIPCLAGSGVPIGVGPR